jgi:two-component system sensor histidine kinase PfeS
MSERLQGTVVLQQQLLRDMSHELRTPLSRCGWPVTVSKTCATARAAEPGDRRHAAPGGRQPATGLAGHRAGAIAQEAIQVQALWDMLRRKRVL